MGLLGIFILGLPLVIERIILGVLLGPADGKSITLIVRVLKLRWLTELWHNRVLV